MAKCNQLRSLSSKEFIKQMFRNCKLYCLSILAWILTMLLFCN